MFTEITKTFESNQKLVKDMTAQLTGASTAFAKAIVDVNIQLAETFKTQATEAFKGVNTFKFPGFDTATKTSKKSAE
jgi:hypothetical protein